MKRNKEFKEEVRKLVEKYNVSHIEIPSDIFISQIIEEKINRIFQDRIKNYSFSQKGEFVSAYFKKIYAPPSDLSPIQRLRLGIFFELGINFETLSSNNHIDAKIMNIVDIIINNLNKANAEIADHLNSSNIDQDKEEGELSTTKKCEEWENHDFMILDVNHLKSDDGLDIWWYIFCEKCEKKEIVKRFFSFDNMRSMVE